MADIPPMPSRAPPQPIPSQDPPPPMPSRDPPPPMPSRDPPTPMPSRAPPAPAPDPTDGPLATGEAVRAFYHMNDHPYGYRFVRLLDGPPEEVPEDAKGYADRCVVGLSTGWIPATVAERWRPDEKSEDDDDRVLVRLHGHFQDPYKKEGPEPQKGLYWKVARSLVRRMSAQQPAAELSLLVVRWWDYYGQGQRRGSRSHNVANEAMLLDVLEGPGSPHAAFAEQGRYEVHTAFIRSSSDLPSLGARLAGSMRGRRRAGFYFLWPTQRAAVERRLAGAVSEPELLALMSRMEEASVRSCWPHDSKLYRELSGKTWPARTSRERPDLRVPLTVEVSFAKFDADPVKAAQDAIAELIKLSSAPADADSYSGVAKLGFSWMGEDVKPFTGTAQLAKALAQLFEGANESAVCLIQQRVENVACELRFICCKDLCAGEHAVQKELVRMRLHPPRHGDETFALTSHLTMGSAEAAEMSFYGNAEALVAAEKEAARLADRWLNWMRDEGYGTPASCRLDFLVSVKPPQTRGAAPDVEVWTVEICECGGSLCNFSCAPRTAAVLNECICQGSTNGTPPPRGFPQALPPFKQEALERPPPSESSGATATQWAGPGRSGRSTGNSTALARQRKQLGPSSGPLSALLAKLGFEGSSGGRAVLSTILMIVALLWLRSRRRR